MNLQLEDGTALDDPGDEDILALLDFLRVPGNTFAVLTHEPWHFLRAERDPRYRFVLRWCEGTPEERFRSESEELELPEVQAAFRAYAQRGEGDPGNEGDKEDKAGTAWAAWKRSTPTRPDFFSVLADPESPHYRRVLHSARTLWLQVAQSFGELPSQVPSPRIRPLADRMAHQVASDLADEEERFRRHRDSVETDVRKAILTLMATVEEEMG